VSDRVDALVERARQEIDVATTLQRAGYLEQAASRAYYAAFYAAGAALLVLGETRSKHSGVISAFGRLAVKDGGFDPRLAAHLRVLYELRNSADYDWLDRPTGSADDPVSLAIPFVDAVAAWISEHRGA
jgi:uncharacterized protein (UPF0332 family)